MRLDPQDKLPPPAYPSDTLSTKHPPPHRTKKCLRPTPRGKFLEEPLPHYHRFCWQTYRFLQCQVLHRESASPYRFCHFPFSSFFFKLFFKASFISDSGILYPCIFSSWHLRQAMLSVLLSSFQNSPVCLVHLF